MEKNEADLCMIIDAGNDSIKFGTNHTPGDLMINLLGRAQLSGILAGMKSKDKILGEEA